MDADPSTEAGIPWWGLAFPDAIDDRVPLVETDEASFERRLGVVSAWVANPEKSVEPTFRAFVTDEVIALWGFAVSLYAFWPGRIETEADSIAFPGGAVLEQLQDLATLGNHNPVPGRGEVHALCRCELVYTSCCNDREEKWYATRRQFLQDVEKPQLGRNNQNSLLRTRKSVHEL